MVIMTNKKHTEIMARIERLETTIMHKDILMLQNESKFEERIKRLESIMQFNNGKPVPAATQILSEWLHGAPKPSGSAGKQ